MVNKEKDVNQSPICLLINATGAGLPNYNSTGDRTDLISILCVYQSKASSGLN